MKNYAQLYLSKEKQIMVNSNCDYDQLILAVQDYQSHKYIDPVVYTFDEHDNMDVYLKRI